MKYSDYELLNVLVRKMLVLSFERSESKPAYRTPTPSKSLIANEFTEEILSIFLYGTLSFGFVVYTKVSYWLPLARELFYLDISIIF